MAEFIRSTLIKDHTTATEVLEKDLPTNAISHLVLSMDAWNATDEATLAELLAFINSVEVTQAGKTIVNLQSEDLYHLNRKLYGHSPMNAGKIATDNAYRNLCLIIPFGRTPYNPAECFPATKKGELTLRVNTTVPATSADNSTINIDCIELVGASPAKYLKSVMSTIVAPGATGDNDVELPIGNDIVCIQLRCTSTPADSTHTFGVASARILVDNREYGYASAQAQCLQGDQGFVIDNQHSIIAAQGKDPGESILRLDFDPVGNGEFLLQTSGKASVKARLNMGVNEATYMTVCELVNV